MWTRSCGTLASAFTMSAEAEGRALAESLRRDQRLGFAPIGDVIDFLESVMKLDVVLMQMPVGLSGMTRKDSFTGAMVVAARTGDSPERQRFSLAHELGHILASDFSSDLTTVHTQSTQETKAHSFARHFLMPLDGVRQLPDVPSPEALTSHAVRHFGVSPEVAAIQLRAAMRLSEGEKRDVSRLSASQLATQFGWGAERLALVERAGTPRSPQRALANAVAAYSQGRMGIATYARIRGVSVPAALEELADAGIVPPDEVTGEDARVPDSEW